MTLILPRTDASPGLQSARRKTIVHIPGIAEKKKERKAHPTARRPGRLALPRSPFQPFGPPGLSGRPRPDPTTSHSRSLSGSIIGLTDLENAGHAEVGGFYRFPSFEPSKEERCQRGYSAFNMKRRNGR